MRYEFSLAFDIMIFAFAHDLSFGIFPLVASRTMTADRTLTDDEVGAVRTAVIDGVTKATGATLRG